MDLEQLKTLSALKYQHSQQALSGLIKRENELRAELERMRAFARTTQAQEPEHAQMRAIGADVIWLGWVGKAQRELNIALANVLAQKEALMAQHRRANGRKIVAEKLADQEASAVRKSKAAVRMQSAIDSTVFGSAD
ncbi:hypothetical protein [uncultured Tateyamaria sp.]|uniref:hypothetical protein n=1 Tax=uncultured Tateyamaria sp. TaxID=455651 RepID=UPI002639305C|nr:hypothetical protein [uncultured Tateyamaria sp.]